MVKHELKRLIDGLVLKMKINKALSVKQPWCWAILNHYKDIEIRTWNTKFRGYIALHAGKKIDHNDYILLKEGMDVPLPLESTLETGKILGYAYLLDVIHYDEYKRFYDHQERHKNKSSWWNGKQKGFVLQDVTKIKPIDYKGQLSLFNVDLEIKK